MMSLYTSPPGSGKSYHALELGLNWIRNGKNVIANFPIHEKKTWTKLGRKIEQKRIAKWDFNPEITIPYLISKSFENGWFQKESQCLLIIDEAGIQFNSRDWQSMGKQRMEWIQFFSQHRKFGYDIVLVAQYDRMIDRQIRGNVEWQCRHLKANNSFFFRWLSLFRITLFMYVYNWYQTKLKGNLRFSIFRKSIAKRYDSMRTFNIEELVAQIEKLYEGQVIPAPVLVQMNLMRAEIEKRLKEKEERLKANSVDRADIGEMGVGGSPSSDTANQLKEEGENLVTAD